jgi:nucleotide-binding universal stress UspA family protein
MKVLCATDLHEKSEAAVAQAHLLRKLSGGRLTLLHVVAPGEAHEGTLEQRMLSAQSRLAQRARHATSPVELIVRCGRPAAVVREVARARRADLVILGPHVRDTWGDALRGTLGERIVADSQCPVLIVRRESQHQYSSVMLALDGSTSDHIVDAAEALPTAPGPRLVVHAHEPPYEAFMTLLRAGDADLAGYSADSMAQAVALIRRGLRRHSRDPRQYRVMVMEARPATAILRAVGQSSPDLLVLGTRGLGRLRRALLGSTAHEVLNATDCDVLLVPDGVSRASRRVAAI